MTIETKGGFGRLDGLVRHIQHSGLSEGKKKLGKERHFIKWVIEEIEKKEDSPEKLEDCKTMIGYLEKIKAKILDKQLNKKWLPKLYVIKKGLAHIEEEEKEREKLERELKGAGTDLIGAIQEVCGFIEGGPDWISVSLDVQPDLEKCKEQLEELGAKTTLDGSPLYGKHKDFYLYMKTEFATFVSRPEYVEKLLEIFLQKSTIVTRYPPNIKIMFFLDQPKQLAELEIKKIKKLAAVVSNILDRKIKPALHIILHDILDPNDVLRVNEILSEIDFKSESTSALLTNKKVGSVQLEYMRESFGSKRYIWTRIGEEEKGEDSYCKRIRIEPNNIRYIKLFKELFEFLKGRKLSAISDEEKERIHRAVPDRESASICFIFEGQL